ncbi:MAG: hypothetical protein QGH33_18770, partial [Pirellulaceae bacterium]|nr:hypothetical protein [Pirellulaceae bacterium]
MVTARVDVSPQLELAMNLLDVWAPEERSVSILAVSLGYIMQRSSVVLIGIGILVASSVEMMSTKAAESQPREIGSDVGTIEGVVIYESDRKRLWRYRRYYVADRKKGHLAEAVVSLAEESLALRPAKGKFQSWTIDQKDYRFIPETLAVRTGDRIKFTNSDPLLHDVTTRQRQGPSGEVLKQNSFSLHQREEVLQVFSDVGGTEYPVTLNCRFHSAMRGWIYVFDHPFFQVTEKEGTFRIEDIPAGKYRLVMVHPAGNLRWDQAVDVKAGGTHRVEIRVSPGN